MTKTTAKSSHEYTGSKSGELLQDIIEENKFILKLVDTIPAKFYFDNDIQEKITSEKHMEMNKKAKSLKRGGELSAKSKHKRAKLDPHCHKSVSQIYEEMELQEAPKAKKNGTLLSSPSLTRAANIAELQERLQKKINELQGKRKIHGDSSKSKRKLKKEKSLQKKAKMVKVNEINMQANKALPKAKKEKVHPPPPKYNKEGNIMYGKLDFSEDGKPNPEKNKEFAGKNFKSMLKKVEKKKEKIENLKAVNPEKALNVEEKEKWKRAILKSENVKVKDDPQLLKKSIKRQEKIKQKKAKAWTERKEQQESRQKARQEKRTKNIKKQKDEKLKKKIKSAKKRGRMITV